MAHIPSQYANITSLDVHLASRYFPLLVGYARKKETVSYSALVDAAKGVYPKDSQVQNAIAVSTGRRLDVVRLFTQERNLLDLSALVIGKSRGEVGSGFPKGVDPVEIRKKIFEFDWSAISTEFEGFVANTKEMIKTRKRRKESDALQLMGEFYKSHKDELPENISEQRMYILELLMEGFSAEETFSLAVDTLRREYPSLDVK